jgi:DNA repair exonuclease SbcCD ATPase subunit
MTKKHVKKCEKIKEKISNLKKLSGELQNNIDSIPAEIIDIKNIIKEITSSEEKISLFIAENIETKEQIFNDEEQLLKINNFISTFNIEELKTNKDLLIEKQEKLNQLISDIKSEEFKLKNQEKKVELLKEVPCGSEYSHCKFIKDAYAAVDLLELTKSVYHDMEKEKGSILENISDSKPEKIDDHLDKYEQVLDKKKNLEADTSRNNLLVDKNNIHIKALEEKATNLKQQSDEYYQNKEIIENKENLVNNLEKYVEDINVQALLLRECEEKMLEHYEKQGSLNQKLSSLQEQKQELADLQEEYSAYDLFMRCMHSSGISYDIIKKKLPVINNEIAKVLANIVNFEIFFEDDGKHLKIFIKHSKHEPRPLQMGSGAEKTIAAMAIRLALLSVSNLPKGNIFILDEPGTALDADNMDGFVSILELVKTYFKTVFLISHLDSLKDCVDTQITIDKKDSYAFVKEV